MNAKEYRKHVGVSKTKYVLDWIDKGYLPNVKNSETGVIDIPSDMPRPYKSNGKTQKISKLIEEIIKAADLQQSIYPQMFPLIREKTFERTIESMVECQIILLNGLDELLRNELHIPVYIAQNALTCVAEGTGILLEGLHIVG